jgi:N-acetylmuramoyl-L-alanine amidase
MESPASPTPSVPPRSGIPTGRILQTTLSVAIILATLFTGFPPNLLSGDWGGRLNLLLTPEAPSNAATPSSNQPLHIGIVSGHWGNDSGAVCQNGTTEAQVNLDIATLVQQKLTALGYNVDLLQEFDSRLNGYRAALLISIHNDSCDFINDQATGFKVAASTYSLDPQLSNRLTASLTVRYATTTGLPFHAGSITINMQDYYAFREVNPETNAAIIETGFLNKDYAILTEQPGLIADGIVAGIQCYVNTENVAPTPTPAGSP